MNPYVNSKAERKIYHCKVSFVNRFRSAVYLIIFEYVRLDYLYDSPAPPIK